MGEVGGREGEEERERSFHPSFSPLIPSKRIDYFQKLGKISITSCIEKDARRLTINIKKVEDLPKWGFLGAPGKVYTSL